MEKLYTFHYRRAVGAAMVEVTEGEESKTLELAPIQMLREETIKASTREEAEQKFWVNHTSHEGNKTCEVVQVDERPAPRIIQGGPGKGFIMEDEK